MDDEPLWIDFALPPEYKEAIGEIVIQWAFFETSFDEFLGLVLLDSAACAIAKFVPFSFSKRVQILRDTVHVAFPNCPELVSRIIAVCADAESAKRDRDLLAHCHWSGTPSDGSLTAYKFPSEGRDFVLKEVSLPWFKTLASKISALSRRIRALTLDMPDFAFPLSASEARVLREFRDRNLPKPPTPQFPSP